jgi:hypothetical protein
MLLRSYQCPPSTYFFLAQANLLTSIMQYIASILISFYKSKQFQALPPFFFRLITSTFS